MQTLAYCLFPYPRVRCKIYGNTNPTTKYKHYPYSNTSPTTKYKPYSNSNTKPTTTGGTLTVKIIVSKLRPDIVIVNTKKKSIH